MNLATVNRNTLFLEALLFCLDSICSITIITTPPPPPHSCSAVYGMGSFGLFPCYDAVFPVDIQKHEDSSILKDVYFNLLLNPLDSKSNI